MSLSELYSKGTRVWLPDPLEVWQGGILASGYKDGVKELTVTLESGEVRALRIRDSDRDLPPLRNPDILTGENNLTSLSYLNEAEVLHNLRIRFLDRRTIYTYCGIVLVALNPYQDLPIYDDTVIMAYSGCEDVGSALEPHVFGVAEQAFNHMSVFGQNQSIIVSGESGSGKTVNARFTLRYLATVASYANGGGGGGVTASIEASGDFHYSQIEDRILASNPILEAFGNAKTTRNDNSSRFGKYIQISFAAAQISHANIRTYLLEKSRVVTQASNERNYHIFYQLCTNEDPALGLGSPDNFQFLSCGQCWTVDNVSDADEFTITRQAFRTLGLTDNDEWNLFTLLAAILHMGNIDIYQGESSESSAIAATDVGLSMACSLLKVDQEQLRTWLLHRRIVTVGEELIKPFTVEEASNARNALSKFMYASVFQWLVALINKALERRSPTQQPRHAELSVNLPFIGILDIYGFEIFQVNSFEQFCINYANEKLQQQFNIHVFKLEQQIYVAEEIDWSFIEFTDNQPCIELIEAKLGILDLLDEECKMLRGSDANWLQKMQKTLCKSPYYDTPKIGSRDCFIVRHFAEPVAYTVHGFLEKNRDAVYEDLMSILKASEIDFLSRLFSGNFDAPSAGVAGGGGRGRATSNPGVFFKDIAPAGKSAAASGQQKFSRQTVATQFKQSLADLMDNLSRTNPHFIRCIKPNDAKAAFDLDSRRAVEQLRACGVLETVRISAAGFPSRWGYEEFHQRYRVLQRLLRERPTKPKTADQLRSVCVRILEDSIRDDQKYRCGKTRIFFRAGQVAYMEKLRSERLHWACVTVQSRYRGWLQRSRYAAVRRAALLTQTYARGLLARRRAGGLRQARAALRLQTWWRCVAQRRKFIRLRRGVVAAQSAWRRILARRSFLAMRAEQMVLDLQRRIRGYLVRRRVARVLRGITLLQSHWRRRQAKRELLKLRAEARDVERLKNKNFGLENRVIELHQRLEDQTAELEMRRAKERQMADMERQLAEAAAREQRLVAERSQIAASMSQLQAANASSLLEASDAQQAVRRQLEAALATERERYEAELAKLRATCDEQQQRIAQLEGQLRSLQDELDDSGQVGSAHMKLVAEFDKLQNRYDNLSRQYAFVVSHQLDESAAAGDDAMHLDTADSGDTPDRPVLGRPRSRTDGGGGGVADGSAGGPISLLLQLQKKLSASERDRRQLQRQQDKLIENQANRERAAQQKDRAVEQSYIKKLEGELKALQDAALKGVSGKDTVMQQLESLRKELEHRREECLTLKAVIGDKLVSEKYGGKSELVDEDGELEMAYQTLQQVNRRLQNELDELMEKLNNKTRLIDQLESDKGRQHKLLTQMNSIFNSPALDSLDSVVKFELQRMMAENLELRAENERFESENKRLRQHSNLALNETDHQALVPVPTPEKAADLAKTVLTLEEPGNAAYLIFCAVRWCDANKQDKIVEHLLSQTVRAWREYCKKHSSDLNAQLLVLSNCHRMLNLLRQYGGTGRYSEDNSEEERQLQLRRFDLDEFCATFHELGVWTYQQICVAMQQSLPSQTLIMGLMEHDAIPGLPSVLKKKVDPEKCRLAFEAVSQRCCELARCARQAGLAEEALTQLVEQTLRWLCGHCFNQLMLRRDLCHWSRGMQLRYNLSQLESALRELGVSGALTALDPLVQACQLLQVNKQTADDAATIASTTNLLSRGQVKKLLDLYTAHDQFEEKVSPEFIARVESRMAEAAQQRQQSQPQQPHDSKALFIDVKELQPMRMAFQRDATQLKSLPIPMRLLEDLAVPGGPGSAETEA